MIVLDFEVDEEELDFEGENPSAQDFLDFMGTIFLMPVRFYIHGVEFFQYETNRGHPYLSLPIIEVASIGLICVREASIIGKTIEYELLEANEVFRFTRLNEEMVKVDFTLNRVSVICHYFELLKVFEDFRDKVRAFLKERVPDMLNHPYWGDWVLGLREEYIYHPALEDFIILDFAIDENNLLADSKRDLRQLDAPALLSSFVMPIRFHVNGVEFFEYASNYKSPYVSLPLLNFAFNGLTQLKKADVLGRREEFPLLGMEGVIAFTLASTFPVKIDFYANHRSSICKRKNLLKFFESFHERVRNFIEERFPEIKENPHWEELNAWPTEKRAPWAMDKEIEQIPEKKEGMRERLKRMFPFF